MQDEKREIEKISEIIKKHKMKIQGVVQVGAHEGNEIPEFLNLEIEKIVCFEPLKNNFKYLKDHYESEKIAIFQCALGATEGRVEMNISSLEDRDFTMSSSILRPKKHLIYHPGVLFKHKEEVSLKKLSSFVDEIKNCNFLIMDVQGYEYEVLIGAEKILNQFDYIYCEVNRDETYENNKLVEDIDDYLNKFKFKRVETWWAAETWGDALYVKVD